VLTKTVLVGERIAGCGAGSEGVGWGEGVCSCGVDEMEGVWGGDFVVGGEELVGFHGAIVGYVKVGGLAVMHISACTVVGCIGHHGELRCGGRAVVFDEGHAGE
jgi:hypothetical protein